MGAAAFEFQPIENVEDFWRWLQHHEGRYELVDGRIVAMAGGTVTHSNIQTNLILAIGNRLRGGPCRVNGSDILVRTKETGRRGRFPDVNITCERETGVLITRPLVLFEILSPDTEITDRSEKLREYQAMPSVMHYVLVAQDAMRVEIYSRDAAGWRYAELEGDTAGLALDPPGVAVPLAEIYEGVELPPPADPGGVEIG